jgi:methionyl aminopeptidase
MKIPRKTPSQIKIMQKGGQKLSSILAQLLQLAKPGINLLKIEKKAIQLIKESGGEPAFARVPGYHWATCLNVNEEIVHGVPRDYLLKPGDVLNIDIGLYYQGFNTDMSTTFLVSAKDTSEVKSANTSEVDVFLAAGKQALKKAVEVAKPGNRVGNISQKIQEIIEESDYSVARNLTGHGIGKELHEPPSIPGFVQQSIDQTAILKPGMTVAIEVIYCQGKPDLVLDPQDKWTFRTKDGKISAVFEETIALKKDGSLILTRLPTG